MSGAEEEGASGEQLQEEEEEGEEGMEMPAIDVPEMMSDEVRFVFCLGRSCDDPSLCEP